VSGLLRVLKMHGAMTAKGRNGQTVHYVYDYFNDVAATEGEMPIGSARRAKSDQARAELMRAAMQPPVKGGSV
jgi:hypothetical protein